MVTKLEKVTDEQLIRIIEDGVVNSVGDFLNSSDLAREREYSTYEYAGIAKGNLIPTGVSKIVDRGTTEVVEAYTAILSDLFLSNKKVARFLPKARSTTAISSAYQASAITNDYIFCYEDGWQKLQTWIKAALLWKNSVIRWDWVEDYEYEYQEFDSIEQLKLDELLSEDNVEVVGELEITTVASVTEIPAEEAQPLDPMAPPQEELGADPLQLAVGATDITYINVKIRKKIDKSRIKLDVIPEENFRISRDANCMSDASYVGIQTDVTRSDVRKLFPEEAAKVKDWDALNDQGRWTTDYTELEAARKEVTGQEYWQGSTEKTLMPDEANREITLTESWLRVDRDGDGIAELKRFITIGDHILLEEYTDEINLASLNPIDIPHEFFGLSMTDFARSSTLASTAILRGFIENVYLTNYSPKLADPNVVDFAALQNMKPKQIIATNGNPTAAVTELAPSNSSANVISALEYLSVTREQATGMSKAAQGLNDQLYVSGNSEAKLAAVQSASQKRIQHIARRFAETGFRRLIKGVYKTLRANLKNASVMGPDMMPYEVDVQSLPSDMVFEVDIDVGENSNANRIQKLTQLMEVVMPVLEKSGQQHLLKADAVPRWCSEILDALQLNPLDYMEDVNSPEYQQKVQASAEQAQADAKRTADAEAKKAEAEARMTEANAAYTESQAVNTYQDNARQLAKLIDEHEQDWAEIMLKAAKDNIQPPVKPSVDDIIAKAVQVIKMESGQEATPKQQQGGIDLSQIPPELIEMAKQNPDMLKQVAQQQGIPPEMVDAVLQQIG